MPSSKSIQYPSTVSSGRDQVTNRVSSGATMATESAEAAAYDPSLIGRKVRTRWPEDNSFYEAVITDYKEVYFVLVCIVLIYGLEFVITFSSLSLPGAIFSALRFKYSKCNNRMG